MSLKNIFTEDEYYESVDSATWSSIVNSTPVPPPPIPPAPFGCVTSMFTQTFSPSTNNVWGFVSSNLVANDATITSPANNQLQILEAGIYRVDFYLSYSAGVGITCNSLIEQVSGTVTQLAACSTQITNVAYSWILQTFIVNIATANAVFQIVNNVSAGTTGVVFDGAGSSILITPLD